MISFIGSAVIKHNTPINPKKAAFMSALILFYNMTMNDLERDFLTKEQKKAHNRIQEFDDMECLCKYPIERKTFGVIADEVVKKYTPKNRRKRLLYFALLDFFDVTLDVEQFANFDKGMCEAFLQFSKDFKEDTFDDYNTFDEFLNLIDKVGVEEEQEEEPKKKIYTVDVHFDGTVTVEVEASSEEEARDLAKTKALMHVDEIDDFEYNGLCNTNVE
jgi:hypothetical protein